VAERARPISIYVAIARTYMRWAPSLLVLAAVVFVPLGLIEAIAVNTDIGSLNPANGVLLAAALGGVVVFTVTGLIGEVFYSGAVAISLTHAKRGQAPSLRDIARRLNYRTLVAVDLLYGFFVGAGLILLLAPGVAVLVWFGLAGPVVEIEERSVQGAFQRSAELVRGRFWTVFWVLGPIEVAGDGFTGVTATVVHGLLGHSLIGSWVAESLSNLMLAPLYAVATVLLTLELITEKDGSEPQLHSAPART